MFQSLFYWLLFTNIEWTHYNDLYKSFQSLFYWLLLTNHFGTFGGFYYKMFQSLFYWLLLTNFKPEDAVDLPCTGFQSLFYWLLLTNPLHLPIFCPPPGKCFNPCFIGSCSRIITNALIPI